MKKSLLACVLMTIHSTSWGFSGTDLIGDARVYQRCFVEKRCVEEDDTKRLTRFYLTVGDVAFHESFSELRGRDFCLPQGGNLGQYVEVVKQFLEQNPAQLHFQAHALVIVALRLAFPCPRKP
jgi:hypothetical protein